jgi:electron transport complex protein RnfE
MPSVYDTLGGYLPLIVVNCIILGRAESFASKNPVVDSLFDGLFMGLGFTLALTLMGAFREILGSASIFGYALWNADVFSIGFLTTSAGAFFTYGIFIALFNILIKKIKKNDKEVL